MSIFLKTSTGAAAIAPVGYESVWEKTAAGAVKLYSSAALPTFDGSCAFFGDAKKGYIECYSSGTLMFPSSRRVDIHLVGGGASGSGRNSSSSSSSANGGGGGGGYTQTYIGVTIKATQVLIGAGGERNTTSMTNGNPGGTTEVGEYSASGGLSNGTRGGNGGSGGGAHATSGEDPAGDGGSDGGNGGSAYSSGGTLYSGGTGQGTTTRDFGETTGTLRAGGGGGGASYHSSSGNRRDGGQGGAGGGGKGYTLDGAAAGDGVPNTGGGGGGAYGQSSQSWRAGLGGSGIAIIRWGY